MHTHRTSSEATATIVFSLYDDDRDTGTRQTPKVPSAIAEIYHCRILAEVQLAHDRRQIMDRPRAVGECPHEHMKVYMRTGGLYTLYHHMHHRRTTSHNSTSSLPARTATSSRRDHTPSSNRSKSTSPIGPPDLSVDAPTISKYRSKPPTIRPFSPITSETPTRNLQVNDNLSPHSLHTHTTPHRRQLLHLTQRRSAPGGDLDSYSYRVRAIYAALDVSGVRGTVMTMARSSLARG